MEEEGEKEGGAGREGRQGGGGQAVLSSGTHLWHSLCLSPPIRCNTCLLSHGKQEQTCMLGMYTTQHPLEGCVFLS